MSLIHCTKNISTATVVLSSIYIKMENISFYFFFYLLLSDKKTILRIDKSVTVQTATAFRDGYLSNSDIGTKYIEYCYIISYFNHVLPNSITLASKYNFAVSCYNIANTFKMAATQIL